MQKINFINNQEPALNDTNLNQLQTNIENAIENVIESGNNTNGNYTKFADGTLIQWGTINVSANTSSYEQTYPIQFISAISVFLTNIYSNSKKVVWTHTTLSSKFTAYPMNYEENNVPTFATSASWIAIGRWK